MVKKQKKSAPAPPPVSDDNESDVEVPSELSDNESSVSIARNDQNPVSLERERAALVEARNDIAEAVKTIRLYRDNAGRYFPDIAKPFYADAKHGAPTFPSTIKFVGTSWKAHVSVSHDKSKAEDIHGPNDVHLDFKADPPTPDMVDEASFAVNTGFALPIVEIVRRAAAPDVRGIKLLEKTKIARFQGTALANTPWLPSFLMDWNKQFNALRQIINVQVVVKTSLCGAASHSYEGKGDKKGGDMYKLYPTFDEFDLIGFRRVTRVIQDALLNTLVVLADVINTRGAHGSLVDKKPVMAYLAKLAQACDSNSIFSEYPSTFKPTTKFDPWIRTAKQGTFTLKDRTTSYSKTKTPKPTLRIHNGLFTIKDMEIVFGKTDNAILSIEWEFVGCDRVEVLGNDDCVSRPTSRDFNSIDDLVN